jgi:lysophospholipase L1-like esterase
MMAARIPQAVLLLLFAVVAMPVAAQEAPAGNRWEATIERFEQADLESPPEAGSVLFVGSSSIVRWDTLAEDFSGITTLNRGFGGSRISDVLHYADRIILPYEPGHVVVYAGENDLSGGRSADEVVADYMALVEVIHQRYPEMPVTWISIKPSPSRWELADEMRRANDRIREWSEGDERLGYVHVFDAMLGPDGEPRAELFVSDMLHMNADGYDLWREIVAPYVE